jgi:nicotinamidase-related amidase
MARVEDKHGNAPQRHTAAVLIVDMVNDFAFEGAAPIRRAALAASRPLARLLARARRAGVPVVYVNDNFGRWQSDFRAQIAHCVDERSDGQEIVERILPGPNDYYVLKPQHSGFYATPLPVLLDFLGVRRVVLAGTTAESCVLFTAMDAYLRGFEVVIASDCVASASAAQKRAALGLMRRSLRARVQSGSRVDLSDR